MGPGSRQRPNRPSRQAAAAYLAGSALKLVAQVCEQKYYVRPSYSTRATAVAGSTVIPQTGSVTFSDLLDMYSSFSYQPPPDIRPVADSGIIDRLFCHELGTTWMCYRGITNLPSALGSRL